VRLVTLEGDPLSLEATTATAATTAAATARPTATTTTAAAPATTEAPTASATTEATTTTAATEATTTTLVTRLGEVQTDSPAIQEVTVLGLEGILRILDGGERDVTETLWLASFPRKGVSNLEGIVACI